MISYLKGKIIARTTNYIILETGGVGYRVFVSEKLSSSFSQGSEAELFCYLHLKKDTTLDLYGVPSLEALELFETLKEVSGIGPKAALNISSLGTPEELRKAIEKGDASFFSGVHGIGQKKIQKVILELTGKIKSIEKEFQGTDKDALDALVALGFSRQKAKEMLLKLPKELQTTEEKIAEALKLTRG